jgi:phosphate transport system substrate-binding protein
MKLSPRRVLAGAAVLGATSTLALGGTAQAAKVPVVTISGSTSVAPLMGLLAKQYVKTKKGKIRFKLAQGGSDVGVADVAAGRVTLGMSARDPKASDPGGIFFNKIAKDAICIVTHPSNRLSNISQETIARIFSGKITDWSDVPGSSASGTIDLIGRTAASGTQDAFARIFMGTSSVSSSLATKASNGLVQQTVQTNRSAVGYVSLDFVQGTNVVGLNGVPCNLRNARSGEYGGVRNFWLVTRGRASGPVARFISWIQNNRTARAIVSRDWVALQ